MTAVTKASRRQFEFPDKTELGALTASAKHEGKTYRLKLLSISEDLVSVEALAEDEIPSGSACEIDFQLLNTKWTRSASLNFNANSISTFNLTKPSRPPSDSRIAKRWQTNRLHPIAGKVRNHLGAGQWIHCGIDNISIGGARVTLTGNSGFLKGQKGLIEIHYPLQPERSHQNFQITDISEYGHEQHLHISFAPITNSHIQSIAKHLIEFEWQSPISAIELDLSNTEWPEHRVETSLTRQGNELQVDATVSGEVVSSLLTVANGSMVQIQKFKLDQRWDNDKQIQSLVTALINDLKSQKKVISIAAPTHYDVLEKFNFKRAEDDEWKYNLSEHNATIEPLVASGRKDGPSLLVNLRKKWGAVTSKEKTLSWDQYGLVYDKMCEVNSSYQELTEGYSEWLESKAGTVEKAVDIGAGTGNFVLKAARQLDSTDIVHVDQDIVMNLFAQEKYKFSNFKNVRIKTSAAEAVTFPDSSLDLVTAVHSLYTLSNPTEMLSQIFSWLKSGGHLYVVDIGRTIDTNEWSKHIFMETVKDRGFISTARYFWDARDAISQNKRIQANQDQGKFWMKTHSEFVNALENTGFVVEKSEVTYRGNSDLAICRKP